MANVEFALKGLSSQYVAKYAIQKFLKGKFYIVPGIKIKLAKFASKMFPSNLVAQLFGFKTANFIEIPEDEKTVPNVEF